MHPVKKAVARFLWQTANILRKARRWIHRDNLREYERETVVNRPHLYLSGPIAAMHEDIEDILQRHRKNIRIKRDILGGYAQGSLVTSSCLVIAYVNNPALGMTEDMQAFVGQHIPVVIIYQKDAPVLRRASRTPGYPQVIATIEWEEPIDIMMQLDVFLRTFTPTVNTG